MVASSMRLWWWILEKGSLIDPLRLCARERSVVSDVDCTVGLQHLSDWVAFIGSFWKRVYTHIRTGCGFDPQLGVCRDWDARVSFQ